MGRSCVLITGGAGYIGSHVCKALAARGLLPVAFDSLITGHRWAVKWGPLVHGELHDRVALERAFTAYRPSAVVHVAGCGYVGESFATPDKYYRHNVSGTIALLDAMRYHGCRDLVFSSTCATYGTAATIPISEDHEQNPISPYGWSKLMAEQILKDYERAFGIHHVSLRYFNAAGADPDKEIGGYHDPEMRIIPVAIEAAFGLRAFVEIFGTDHPTPDGTAIRDYVHVTDVAVAHALALEHLLAGKDSVALNLGTGRGYSVREVVRAVESATRLEVPVRESHRREGDPSSLVADPSRASAMLGWRPNFLSLEPIIESAVRWFEARSTLSRIRSAGSARPVSGG